MCMKNDKVCKNSPFVSYEHIIRSQFNLALRFTTIMEQCFIRSNYRLIVGMFVGKIMIFWLHPVSYEIGFSCFS